VPVSHLLATTSSRELCEYMALYELDPWGEERADMRAGIVAATVANVFRGKNTKPLTPSDFMPRFGPRVRESAALMKTKLKAFAEMFKKRKQQRNETRLVKR
jgi:hypothetical protein